MTFPLGETIELQHDADVVQHQQRLDVKPGHGLTRVLSFPSPSGWRDQMTAFIERREFISLLGGAAAWSLAARAQQPERMRRIGVLSHLSENDPTAQQFVAAFRQRLQELGWVEGRNAGIDIRWGAGDEALYGLRNRRRNRPVRRRSDRGTDEHRTERCRSGGGWRA
jgi:hypothetical protein